MVIQAARSAQLSGRELRSVLHGILLMFCSSTAASSRSGMWRPAGSSKLSLGTTFVACGTVVARMLLRSAPRDRMGGRTAVPRRRVYMPLCRRSRTGQTLRRRVQSHSTSSNSSRLSHCTSPARSPRHQIPLISHRHPHPHIRHRLHLDIPGDEAFDWVVDSHFVI